MVFLTMTTVIVEGLEKIRTSKPEEEKDEPREKGAEEGNSADDSPSENLPVATVQEAADKQQGTVKGSSSNVSVGTANSTLDEKAESTEPSLENPKVGNPISHGQVIDLSRQLKAQGLSPCSLEILLKGVRVYIPPPPAKKEPTSEYKALMARLRYEEENRAYSRMTQSAPPLETFASRFPTTSSANAFAMNHEPASSEEEEVVYADIDRQVALILNVLVSIVACAGAIWVVARWWSTPVRLALSMSGSALVGIAEVVVYSGYIRRVGEAKGKEGKLKEVKEVVKTWVIGGEDDDEGFGEESHSIPVERRSDADSKARRRRKENS
ncbi:hypothetical protein LHYA1_G008438 [Lachnellula hyalina]|uniref:Vacuolar ATPase assembly integral membrane protein VPH2 n=1 Tax=Lachnellula hyalina TaxID=1316788 RepID=A0A8H8QUD0_9HELO|nr:uncharacterized protein LHYA1_G008438 [Lachnellula hyalina]TVY22943.1 hypothetical protein LHYA1_G008438 [Lachnellula hyalina]